MIYPIHHLPDKVPVGVQTEQGVEDIGFDIKHWLAVFPDMVFTVWATRPGEQEAYPVNEQMLIGSVLYWHPDGYDTAIAGAGKVEIVGVGENRRKLSGFVPTVIDATSMGATKEPGENTVPWYEKIINAAIEIMADVDVGAGGLYLVTASRNGSQYVQRVDRTQTEIREAVASGKTCMVVDADGRVYSYLGEKKHETSGNDCPTFIAAAEYNISTGITYWRAQVLSDGSLSTNGYKPAKTPNPYKLTIKQGAESIDYDGSKAVAVEIAPGGLANENLIIHMNEDLTHDTTFESVHDAILAGKYVVLQATLTNITNLRPGVYIAIPTALDDESVGFHFAVPIGSLVLAKDNTITLM